MELLEKKKIVAEEWMPAYCGQGKPFKNYDVSSCGRVRSFNHKNGRRKAPIIMKQNTKNKYGHKIIQLWKGNRFNTVGVGRLVLMSFGTKRDFDSLECRHLDGNPNNNSLFNLRWGTSQENANDMVKHGTQAKGEKNGFSKLTEDAVLDIRKNCNKYGDNKKYAKKYNVCEVHISKVKNKKVWGWLKWGM